MRHQPRRTQVLLCSCTAALIATACGASRTSPGGEASNTSEESAAARRNKRPTVDAGADQSVAAGASVTLAGSASDADGSVASYEWTQTAGSAVTLDDAASANPSFTAPDVSSDETLTFKLTATDDQGARRSDSVNVNVSASAQAASQPPAGTMDRRTSWKPGVTYNGGIPSSSWPIASTITCANTTADLNTLQNAMDSAHNAHPSGAVVKLNAGTCNLNAGYLTVPSNVALRGAGAGVTTLAVTNGARSGSNNPGSHNAMLVILGPARFTNYPNIGVKSSINLTADAAKESTTATVASTSGLSVGQYVHLDELSGAKWMPDPTDPNGERKVWASPDYSVVWNFHLPSTSAGGYGSDDCSGSDATGPYDSGNVRPPASTGWFSRPDRPHQEVKKIAAINGNTLTFTTPLRWTYHVAQAAQVGIYEYPFVEHAGLENVTVTGGDGGNVTMNWCGSCWVKQVESTFYSVDPGVSIGVTLDAEVRDSYLHTGAYPVNGGGGYNLSLQYGATDTLIENNISREANKVMVARAAGAGAVVGYNYFDAGYILNSDGNGIDAWVEVHANGSHMVGPHHILFEGNWAPNFDSDKTHGNSTYHTVFRNYFQCIRSSFQDLNGRTETDSYSGTGTYNGTSHSSGPLRCIGSEAFTYYQSFIGNVLGSPGQMGSWAYQQISGNDTMSTPSIWLLGWDDWSPYHTDSQVYATTELDGNFDYQSNAIHWDGIGGAGSTPTTLPSSLYLSAKPAFFGSNTWPWVTPDGATKLFTLPAKARFDAGTPNVVP